MVIGEFFPFLALVLSRISRPIRAYALSSGPPGF
jgi:hypothetical protein